MRIVILVPSRVQSLDVVGPAEVFGEAARRLDPSVAYAVQIMSAEPAPIVGTGGVRFLADRTIADPDGPIDTLLVAGDPWFSAIDPTLIAWLRRRAPEARRYGSVCSGVFLLATAGLIAGKRVTTHWEDADQLARQYPDAIVDADKIFVRDGALCTTAGVTAGMDLALALVEEDHGRDLALEVARHLVMFLKRPGGQSQFSAHLAAQMSHRTCIQRAQAYVVDNLASALSVDLLASHVGMSPRHFARMFRAETKMTPGAFVEAARLDAARGLLEDVDLPLQRIAVRLGFGGTNGMRRAL